MDDQIPSVPSTTGVQIVTYSKLLNVVILLFSVSTNVDFVENRQSVIYHYIICFLELVRKFHFCSVVLFLIIYCSV